MPGYKNIFLVLYLIQRYFTGNMVQTTAASVVGRNVRKLREQSGESILLLCRRIGMSRKFWYDIEDGSKNPSITSVERIAGALSAALGRKVSINDLLEVNGRKSQKVR